MKESRSILFALLGVAAGIVGTLTVTHQRETGIAASPTRSAPAGKAPSIAQPAAESDPAPSGASAKDKAPAIPAGKDGAVEALAGLDEVHNLESLGFRLAGQDLTLGLQQALAFQKDDPRRHAILRGMFWQLRQKSPREAMAALRKLTEKKDQFTAMQALLFAPGESINYIQAPQDAGSALVMKWYMDGSISAAEAADFSSSISNGHSRAFIMGHIAAREAGKDLQAALALANEFDGAYRARFMESFSGSLADKDPAAAWNIASQIGDESTRTKLLKEIARRYALADPAAAAGLLQQVPPGTDLSRQIAAEIGAGWGGRDTAAAAAWADSIANDDDHNAAIAGIQTSAPVGIGAVLAGGADGFVLIKDLVPGSSAEASRNLRAGDSIAAVLDSHGVWRDTRKMSIEDVANLVRGPPGSAVSMRILGTGDSDPARARVVTITRQQLMFKRNG